MELKEILEEIRRKPTVPLWPHVAKALGISRYAVVPHPVLWTQV
jgi:hypothetical protein